MNERQIAVSQANMRQKPRSGHDWFLPSDAASENSGPERIKTGPDYAGGKLQFLESIASSASEKALNSLMLMVSGGRQRRVMF